VHRHVQRRPDAEGVGVRLAALAMTTAKRCSRSVKRATTPATLTECFGRWAHERENRNWAARSPRSITFGDTERLEGADHHV
jgi:hypothetical protein